MKQKERDAAKQLYKSKEGKTQLKDIQRKAKTFTPGEPLPEATNKNTNAAGLTPEQVGEITRRSILGSDSMTKSDCSLIAILSECSLGAL